MEISKKVTIAIVQPRQAKSDNLVRTEEHTSENTTKEKETDANTDVNVNTTASQNDSVEFIRDISRNIILELDLAVNRKLPSMK